MKRFLKESKTWTLASLVFVLIALLVSLPAKAGPDDYSLTLTTDDTSANVTISNVDGSGILVNTNTVNIGHLTTLTSTYYGLRITGGGDVTLNSPNISFTSDGGTLATANTASILNVAGTGSILRVNSNLILISNISTNSSSQTTYGASGIDVGAGAQLKGNIGSEISITINGSKLSENQNSKGSAIHNEGTLDLSDSAKVTIISERSSPAVKNVSGTLKLGDDVSITSNAGHGIISVGFSGTSILEIGDGANIKGKTGIYAFINATGDVSRVTVGDDVTITSTDEWGYGVYVNNVVSTIFGDRAKINEGNNGLLATSDAKSQGNTVVFGEGANIAGTNCGVQTNISSITFGKGATISGKKGVQVTANLNDPKVEVIFKDNTTINATGTTLNSIGLTVSARENHPAEVTFGSGARITSIKDSAVVANPYTTITFGDDATIIADIAPNDQALNNIAAGVKASGSAVVTFGDNAKVEGQMGIRLTYDATSGTNPTVIFGDDAKITGTSKVITDASGVNMNSGSAQNEIGFNYLEFGHRATITGFTGVYLFTDNSIKFLNDAKITGTNKNGLYMEAKNSFHDVKAEFGERAEITAVNSAFYIHNHASAPSTYGESTATFGDNATFKSTGTTNNSYGIFANTNNANSRTYIKLGTGVTISGNTGMSVTNSEIDFMGTANITGNGGNSVYVTGGGILNFAGRADIVGVNGLTVQNANSSLWYQNTTITFEDEAYLTGRGNLGVGISLTSYVNNDNIQIFFKDKAEIKANEGNLGSAGINIYDYTNGSARIAIEFQDEASIISTNNDNPFNYGVRSVGGIIDFKAKATISSDGHGVSSSGSKSVVTFEGETDITTVGTGIYAANSGTVALNKTATIKTTGASGAHGFYSENGIFRIGTDRIVIEVTGNGSDALYFKDTTNNSMTFNNSKVTSAGGNLITNASDTATSTVTFTGTSEIYSDLKGTIVLNLEGTTEWEGGTTADNVKDVVVNMQQGATWLMNKSSKLKSLDLGDAQLTFDHNTLTNTYLSLTASELKGDGTMAMNVDMTEGSAAGDRLDVVDGTGSYVIALNHTNSGGEEKLVLVTAENPNSLTFALTGSEVQIGAFRYSLKQEIYNTSGVQWF